MTNRERSTDRPSHGVRSLVEALPDPAALVDRDLRVVAANAPFADTLGVEATLAPGAKLTSPDHGEWEHPALLERLAPVLNGTSADGEGELPFDHPNGKRMVFLVRARRLDGVDGLGTAAALITLSGRELADGLGRETNRLQQAAMESAANAIFVTDSHGVIVWVNPAFETLSGFTAEEAIGNTPRILKSGQQNQAYYEVLWNTIAQGKPWSGRVVNRHRHGHLYTVEQTVTPMADESGEVTHFVAIHEDITARVESERQLAHMARHDFLTDLPNRFYLEDHIDLEIARVDRHGGGMALLWFDLDHFKAVNDTYGHAIGDELLVAVAGRVRRSLRDLDTPGRLGGDEFAILQRDLRGERDVENLARRLLGCFDPPFEFGDTTIHVGASIGISTYSGGGIDKAELMKQADLALYRAKSDGRGTFRLFAKEMDDEVQRRMLLSQDLHGAIGGGQLFMEYQPQVDLNSRRIVGVEALVRWRHPRFGLVSPELFVPIAESSGLIEAIGEWVLRTTCRQAKDWQDRGLAALPVGVNLSGVQLRNPDFPDLLAEILAATGLAPTNLELELTETVFMEAGAGIEETLDRLHAQGVRLSLDDFGSGYASLDYLRRFPLSKLKIDRSFVSDMARNAKNATIVSAVIALASKLDLTVIAEGVEPAHLLDRLIDEGCEEVQGFYFSHPISPDDLEKLLARGSERIRPSR